MTPGRPVSDSDDSVNGQIRDGGGWLMMWRRVS